MILTLEQIENSFPETELIVIDGYGKDSVDARWLHQFARSIEQLVIDSQKAELEAAQARIGDLEEKMMFMQAEIDGYALQSPTITEAPQPVQADGDALRKQISHLESLALDHLQKLDEEAKAFMSYENAKDNFSSSAPEQATYELRMTQASSASKALRAALSQPAQPSEQSPIAPVSGIPASQSQEPEYCPACDGSGESSYLSDNGPDARDIPCNCPHCDGKGTLADAYEGVCKLLEVEKAKYLKVCGELNFKYYQSQAIEENKPRHDLNHRDIRALLYSETINDKQVSRDDLWIVSTRFLHEQYGKACDAIDANLANTRASDEEILESWDALMGGVENPYASVQILKFVRSLQPIQSQPAPPQPSPAVHSSAQVRDSVVAGALFDFMGMLTSQEEETHFSSHHEAGIAVKMIERFAMKRGLSLDEARVKDWRTAMQSISSEPAQQEGE